MQIGLRAEKLVSGSMYSEESRFSFGFDKQVHLESSDVIIALITA